MNEFLKLSSVKLTQSLLNRITQVLSSWRGSPPLNGRNDPLNEQLHALSIVQQYLPVRELLEVSVQKARSLSSGAIDVFDLDVPPVLRVESVEIDRSDGGILPVRIYANHTGETQPACIFYHGGGFVLGNLDTHDSFCRILARQINCKVISVDYRRAPENTFPAAIKDGITSLQWVRKHSENLKINPNCIAVAGDSAGATLATVVCQRQIIEDKKCPDYQLLMYPKTDYVGDYPSRRQPAENLFLSWRTVKWFSEQYLDGIDVNPQFDHRISPLQFEKFKEMPPTFLITAGFDPLRDEGIAYANKLRKSGVQVLHKEFGKLIHGFISIGGLIDEAREAIHEIVGTLQEELNALGS